MPLLIFLGSQLSNKVSTDLYQRHRDTESWTWKKSGRPVKYRFQTVQTGSDESRVALLLCLSGSGPREMLPAQIDPAYFVYELTLDGTTPSPTFLSRSEEHTSELQSLTNLVCRLLLEKKKAPPMMRAMTANTS